MRRLVWLVAVASVVVMVGLAGAAEIVSVSGGEVTIPVGSRDGVRVGMTGKVTTTQMVSGRMMTLEVATFSVVAVAEGTCVARLVKVGTGWTIQEGMGVVFDPPSGQPGSDKGTINVRSNVTGDMVYLDGKMLGSTPQKIQVDAGRHTVRVEKAGYNPTERRVRVGKGQKLTVQVELSAVVTPKPVRVSWPRGSQAGQRFREPIAGLAFRFIPAGVFMMGSLPDGPGWKADEGPQHRVGITRGFWMGETEVTQQQWESLMGSNPSYFGQCGGSCPVEQVSWFDAVSYANALSKRSGLEQCYEISGEYVRFKGLGCRGYRLPTEAEWEYAARANRRDPHYGGGHLDALGWYRGNSGESTRPVGEKRGSRWGLYDMLGNVWEWCWDWYRPQYPGGTVTDPTGPSSGNVRVLRGGSWSSPAESCRYRRRGSRSPDGKYGNLGFRLVRTASE